MKTWHHQIDDEHIDQRIAERLRLKKKVNLIISVIIVLLAIATLYMAFGVEVGISSFVYLTINATIFTTLGSLAFIAANVYELKTGRELTSVPVYYIRLSCAVTETVVMLVILIGFIMGDPSGLDKWNQVGNHIIIPVLTISSFITNDAPIGRVTPLKRFYCTAFITVYAIIIIGIFSSGILSMEMIPYPFLDWRVIPVWQIVCYAGIVYLIAFIVATVLYHLNRKLSWLWFRDLAKGQ